MVDFYEVLEITRTASESDIKKSYRRLALRWHPDKNPDRKDEAEKKFKEISQAYDVLSDPKKRSVYDQYGVEGLMGQSVQSGHGGFGPETFMGFDAFMGFTPFASSFFRDPNEIFREFFGNDPFVSDLFGFGSASRHHPSSSMNQHGGVFGGMGAFGMSPINPMGGMSQLFDMAINGFGGGFESSFASGPMIGNSVRSVKKVKVVNGKVIEQKTVVKDGVETTTISENGRVVSRTVKDQPNQAIQYHRQH